MKYWISEITATVEGAVSAELGSIDCGAGSNVDVDLSHASFGGSGTKYYIYRSQANEGTPYFLTNSEGGQVFSDGIPDRDLGSEPFLNGDYILWL